MSAKMSNKPRGEIAELTASLQSLCTMGKRSDKELRAQKREVFRKVINYLTVGMDMSSLFPSMTSCANLSPDDIVLKKMLYLYITHYAAQTPDLALLTINQLHKDCVDQDPTVRGLALRSLCSLRLANFLEYVTTPVSQGLEDRHPYVRRTAAMGVLKIFHIDQQVVHNTGMLERVRGLLYSDPDAQVIANCLVVMLQAEGREGLLDKALLYQLLNRLKEFTDWAQCAVLELAAVYRPSGEAEVYDLLNALEDRLAAANSAVVLAATKAFLHLTLALPATHQQVLERIKEPLKSLIGRDDPAVGYAVLSHMLLLVQRAPVIFEGDHTAFYCRTHDPSYIKQLKMEILAAIACSTNVYDIVGELTEYARDVVAPSMAREAVRAVGRIALAVPDVPGIVERLLVFLDSACDAVVAEALVQMKDLLRRYPDMAELVVAQLAGQLHDLAPDALAEPEARAAVVWIIGQFGQHIPDAPYLLEPLAEGYEGEDPRVRAALLTAATQLFFRRPPECSKLLGRLLAVGVQDSNQDVHDRALLYYRLLRTNVAEAERIINPPLLAVASFSEALSPEVRETIFQEFNSLSVVYQTPASTFVDRRGYHTLPLDEGADDVGGTPAAGEPDDLLLVDNATNLLDDVDGAPASHLPGNAGASDNNLLDLMVPGAAPTSGAGAGVPLVPLPTNTGTGLIGLDMLGGLGLPSSSTPMAAQLQPPAPHHSDFDDLGMLLGGSPSALPPGLKTTLGNTGGNGVGPAAGAGAGGLDLLAGFGGLGVSAPVAPAGPPRPAAAPVAAAGGALMDFGLGDFVLPGFGGPPAAAPAPPKPAVPELSLNPSARIAPAAFQDKWKVLPISHTASEPLTPATLSALPANGHKDFTSHMAQAYIQTMASGGQPPQYKYYFYGQQAGSGALLLLEAVARTDSRTLSVTIKSDAPELVPQFAELWSNCFMGFCR